MRASLLGSVLLVLTSARVALGAPGPDLCATFSIVARDTLSGELGVGVQSHWFSVGAIVPWAEAGVGAVATQSFVEPAYGPKLLERMRNGERATWALVAETDLDTLRAVRQVIAIDARGNAGGYTGEECIPHAGHKVKRNHVCAGNLLAAPDVWLRMSEAFEKATGTMAERIVAALEAGQQAGGDARGKQSAALLVVKMVDPEKPWKNRIVDLRVEDHPEPIAELKRLVLVQRAYALADEGDQALARKDYPEAMRLYDAGVELQPENDELIFWRGSMKMATGDEAGAARDVAEAIRLNDRWKPLLARIPEAVFPGIEPLCKRLKIDRTR
jgi:uncharacterized Ntn-hydrolase superfamily protein